MKLRNIVLMLFLQFYLSSASAYSQEKWVVVYEDLKNLCDIRMLQPEYTRENMARDKARQLNNSEKLPFMRMYGYKRVEYFDPCTGDTEPQNIVEENDDPSYLSKKQGPNDSGDDGVLGLVKSLKQKVDNHIDDTSSEKLNSEAQNNEQYSDQSVLGIVQYLKLQRDNKTNNGSSESDSRNTGSKNSSSKSGQPTIRMKNGFPIAPDHEKIPGYTGPRWVKGRLVIP